MEFALLGMPETSSLAECQAAYNRQRANWRRRINFAVSEKLKEKSLSELARLDEAFEKIRSELSTEHEELQKKLAGAEQAEATLRAANQSLSAQLAALQQQLSESDKVKAGSEEATRSLRTEHEELQKKLAGAEQAEAAVREVNQTLFMQLAALQQQFNEFDQVKAGSEEATRSLRTEHAELQKKLAGTEQAEATLREANQSLSAQLAALQKSLHEMEKERTALEENNWSLQVKQQGLQRSFDELEKTKLALEKTDRTLSLPREDLRGSIADSGTAARQVTGQPSASAGLRVLIGDSDSKHRETLAAALRTEGIQVNSLGTSHEIMRVLQREAASGAPYQCVLLDAERALEETLRLAQAITSARELAGVAVLLMSQPNQLLDDSQLRQAGVRSCLFKPVGGAELARLLKRFTVKARLL